MYNKRNKMGDTSGAGTHCPYGAREFTHVVREVAVAHFSNYVKYCADSFSSFVLFSFDVCIV